MISKELINLEIRKLNKFLGCQMITDHAGEIGAVYIYYGAKHSLIWKKYFISKSNTIQLSSFIDHHLKSEQNHLAFFEEIMPKEFHTNLKPFWIFSGYSLGYISMSVSPYFFYKTIEYVEDFVVKHYNQQIHVMKQEKNTPNLQSILESFCEDEDEHRKQGLEFAQTLTKESKNVYEYPYEYPMWKGIVQNGSKYATIISKLCKGF